MGMRQRRGSGGLSSIVGSSRAIASLIGPIVRSDAASLLYLPRCCRAHPCPGVLGVEGGGVAQSRATHSSGLEGRTTGNLAAAEGCASGELKQPVV